MFFACSCYRDNTPTRALLSFKMAIALLSKSLSCGRTTATHSKSWRD